jgi:MoxR-like ATPase
LPPGKLKGHYQQEDAIMSFESLQTGLAGAGYVADDTLSMALHLAIELGRPLLLEGPAGVGKTEIAKALAEVREARLIRLQCYEGLDASHAIYEWNYQRQLLAIRADGASEAALFSEKYLLKRPLLEAISQDSPPVLLIDEIDRADEEFEAYLLEILSDFQITIPELGTIAATTRPLVILTANGTRDLSDALRRRCLYAYVDYPDRETELAILNKRAPGIEARLARQIVGVVQALRREDLEKTPGIAEMLDWAAALSGLGVNDMSAAPEVLQSTLVCLLKTAADRDAVPREIMDRLVGKVA